MFHTSSKSFTSISMVLCSHCQRISSNCWSGMSRGKQSLLMRLRPQQNWCENWCNTLFDKKGSTHLLAIAAWLALGAKKPTMCLNCNSGACLFVGTGTDLFQLLRRIWETFEQGQHCQQKQSRWLALSFSFKLHSQACTPQKALQCCWLQWESIRRLKELSFPLLHCCGNLTWFALSQHISVIICRFLWSVLHKLQNQCIMHHLWNSLLFDKGGTTRCVSLHFVVWLCLLTNMNWYQSLLFLAVDMTSFFVSPVRQSLVSGLFTLLASSCSSLQWRILGSTIFAILDVLFTLHYLSFYYWIVLILLSY